MLFEMGRGAISSIKISKIESVMSDAGWLMTLCGCVGFWLCLWNRPSWVLDFSSWNLVVRIRFEAGW